ncbi:hypothetical protein OF83DRAFT_1178941 [Amylostereum chailletii]|nr:hypothetical protein OF83DRAFT_1178941 [Amylostereum chailletii]
MDINAAHITAYGAIREASESRERLEDCTTDRPSTIHENEDEDDREQPQPIPQPPISRIPTELFTKILSYCVACDVTEVAPWEQTPQALRYISVCSHWRQIIEGCPSLWSVISLTWPEQLIRVYLERSGDTLLSFSFSNVPLSPQQHRAQPFFDAPPSYLNADVFRRIRVLFLRVRHGTQNVWRALLSSYPLPCLEQLYLPTPYAEDLVAAIYSHDNVGRNIQAVSLTGRICPDAPVLRIPICLTSLSLQDVFLTSRFSNGSTLFPPHLYLDILGSLRFLQDLSIKPLKWFPQPTEFFDTVDIPALKSLEISGDSTLISFFLSFLHLPMVTSMKFILESSTARSDLIQDIVGVANATGAFFPGNRPPFHTLSLHQSTIDPECIITLSDDTSISGSDPPRSICFLTPLTKISHHIKYRFLLSSVLPVLPLSDDIRCLKVNLGDKILSGSIWHNTFLHSSLNATIDQVEVHESAGIGFVEALSLEKTFLPRLSHITFARVDAHDPEVSTIFASRLSNALQQRNPQLAVSLIACTLPGDALRNVGGVQTLNLA